MARARACPPSPHALTTSFVLDFIYYNTKDAFRIALLIRAGWRGRRGSEEDASGDDARDEARDDGRDDARAAVISARRRRISSSRYRADSAFDRSSAMSEIS